MGDRFKTVADYAAYRTLSLWQHAYHLAVSVDCNSTPTRPHALLTFYPDVREWKKRKPSGLDRHWHMPLSKWQAVMLRDWLTKYINDVYPSNSTE